MVQGQTLTSRTARGMAWAYGSYVGGRLLVLVATAILARLLTPADFGLVALALTFTAFLDMLSGLGMTEALIIVDEREIAQKANTAFTVMVSIGAVLTLGSVALGPVAADFYHQPELRLLLPVLGATFLLSSLGSAHYALAQKRMDFRSRTAAEMVEVVVRGVIGISLALAGTGAWSLVAGYVAGSVAMTSALWRLVPWRPRLRIDRTHLRELLGFGSALAALGVVAALILNIDKLVIGRELGDRPLGLYTLASRLPELVIINLTIVAGQVLFPAYASLDRTTLARAMTKSLRYALILVLPIGALMAVLATPVLVAVFGGQWRPAATAMQLFTLMSVLSVFRQIFGTVWKATGQAGALLRFALLELVALVPAVVLLVHHGIAVVAACQAGSTLLVSAVALPIIRRMLGMRWRTFGDAVWPPLVAAGAMVLVLWGVRWAVPGSWGKVAVGAVAGGAVYLAAIWWLARDSVHEIVRALLPGLERVPPPPVAEDPQPVSSAVT